MSRVLTQGDDVRGRNGNAQIYADLLVALSPCSRRTVLEIEILGKSHPLPTGTNVLVDGNSIALSKKNLVQAFIIARTIFLTQRSVLGDDEKLAIMGSSAVMLIMDAENLTAVNARKRVILARVKGADHMAAGDQLELKTAVISDEMAFLESLLTSPLHRHTKSPTLWSHRRWLVTSCVESDLLPDLEREMSVVKKAAERHPRNYYAWSHMRWFMSIYWWHKESDVRENYPKLVADVQHWCLKHPADTSGWSFLLHLVLCLPTLRSAVSQPSVALMQKDSCVSVCEEILDLTLAFRWRNEAVWAFLRTLISCSHIDGRQRQDFIESIKKQLLENKTQDCTYMQRGIDWCFIYHDKQ